MTSLALPAPADAPEVRGCQQPRISWIPPSANAPAFWTADGELRIDKATTGWEAIELARLTGLELDPWQAYFLANSLNERENETWAALRVGLVVARQNGKDPYDLDMRVLTTDGWTTMGDVQVGQYVFGSNGIPTRVIGRSDVLLGERCHEVEFTDGSKHVVSETHLWTVWDKDGHDPQEWERCSGDRKRFRRGAWRTLQTVDIASSRWGCQREDNGRMEYRYRVRCDTVPQTSEVSLPVDPYLFGYWLGDGTKTKACLTVGTEDCEWVRSFLAETGARVVSEERSQSGAFQIRFSINSAMRDGFESRIRQLGAWGNKHIPEQYLTSGATQRLALLQGLMDSDGSIGTSNRSPQVEFSSSNERLASDFHRLTRSLGIRVTPQSRATTHKRNWRFLWTPTFNPFRLPRKAQHWRAPVSERHKWMSITNVQKVPSVPVRCIQVEAADGMFLAGETFVPTHNCILEARELAGLFLLDERLIIHSAHRWDTSLDHLARLLEKIESAPDLDRQVAKVKRTHGEEGILLRDGTQMNFRTRTKDGGRGLTGDLVVLNEAMDIPAPAHGALMPTLRARPNPQIWYTGTAVDEEFMNNGVVLARVRSQGIKAATDGNWAERSAAAKRLMYCEWSVDEDEYENDPDGVSADPEQWAKASPGLGIRIETDFVEAELSGLDARTFATEILSVGHWPDPSGNDQVIADEDWAACQDEKSVPEDPVCFAFDVSPDRRRASVAVSGRNADGCDHVEIIKRGTGTGWIVDLLVTLKANHRRATFACEGIGPAGSLLSKLEDAKIVVEVLTAGDHANACGIFYDAVDQGRLRHTGKDKSFDAAVRGGVKRKLLDRWAWDRKNSSIDISPLVAATFALWGNRKRRGSAAVIDSREALADEDGDELTESDLPPLDPEDLD